MKSRFLRGLACCLFASSFVLDRVASAQGTPFDECGLVVQTIECLEFWPNSGGAYRLSTYGGAQSGELILATGTVEPLMPPFLPCGLDGFVTVTGLAPCNSPVCTGDGGDQNGCTDCPCGNNAPPGTAGGCLNSVGDTAELLRSGSSSLTSANLRFELTGAPPIATAVLVSGSAVAPANLANPCFGLQSGITATELDGLRCAVQNVLRHGVRAADSNGDIGPNTNGWGSPDGFFNFAAFTIGEFRAFQVYHRDDEASGCSTGQNTSQAERVLFLP